MKNLDYFIYAVRTHACTENMYLDLTPDGSGTVSTGAFGRYHTKDMRRLAEALASGNCLPGLRIDLYANSLGNKGIAALAEGLKSKNRPERLSMNLSGNDFDDRGFIAILQALKVNSETPGLTLTITGKDPFTNGFKSQFGGNSIGDKSMVALAESIRNGSLPPNFDLNLSNNCISNRGGVILVEALKAAVSEGRYLKGFQLNLSHNAIEHNLREQIASLLRQINQLNVEVRPEPVVDPFLQPTVSVTTFSVLRNNSVAQSVPVTNENKVEEKPSVTPSRP